MYALLSVHLSLPPTATKDTPEHRQINVDTDFMILHDQNRRVVSEGVQWFSSDHSLHRYGQSLV